MFLPMPVWESRAQESFNGLVKWIYSDVPNDWLNWSIKNRALWWSDPTIRETFIKLGLTRKRDRISTVEVWCEFYGYSSVNCTQRYARSLNKLLGSIPTLERVKGRIRCGPYGLQRGFKVHHPDEQHSERL